MTSPTIKHTIIATDVVILSIIDGTIVARMMRVHRPPYYDNQFGFPGGLIDVSETAEEAALRIIKDKAELKEKSVYIEQLQTFSALGRDKRGKVVSVAYLALVPWESLKAIERESHDELAWIPVKKLKGLAYDHDHMLRVALERFSSRVTYTTLISKIMPKEFTLTELEKTFELVSNKNLDKRNFRKKIEKLGILSDLNKKTTGVKHRPESLYSFESDNVKILEML
jgi:8-oxo-dGTP diphosphatase